MAKRMARAIAKRMAKPMRFRWQNYAPNPNPNPNLLFSRSSVCSKTKCLTTDRARASRLDLGC